MIKIINISTSNIGGAGNAVERINSVLNQFSNSYVVSLNGISKKKSLIIPNYNFYFLKVKVIRYLKHIYYVNKSNLFNKKYNFYNYGESKNYFDSNRLLNFFPFVPDILIVHFTAHFINFKTIYEIQKLTGCKVLFNAVDTSFMTGGCHWSWDCRGYFSDCIKCPAIISDKKANLSYQNFLEKKFFLEKINFEVNVSSSFAAKQVKSSNLFKTKNPSLIFYPIDQEYFKPQEYRSSINKKNIFFGTQDFKNPSKGIKYFLESLDFLAKVLTENQIKQITINIAGGKSVIPIPKKFKTNYLGKLSIEKLIIEYSKSDVFVCSSVEDNGPMMINESLMCGTPVVCFDTGIGPDLINEFTGYLARNMSSSDLAKGINYVLFNSESKNWTDNSRNYAINNYGNKIIENKWRKLINSLSSN